MSDECDYCGEPDAHAEMDELLQCHTGGCDLVFDAEDVNPEDLRFGFHIVTNDDLTNDDLTDDELGIWA